LTGKCSGLVGLVVGVHFVCIPQGGSQHLYTSLYSNHCFVHNFMRIMGVKISIHITNFTLIDVHVPFADKSKFQVMSVLYFVVYVTVGYFYYLNTLFIYGFLCTPPLVTPTTADF
jgi:hypothetical protein